MPLFPKTITYEYHTADGSAGYYDTAGDWIAGTTGTSTFQGSVQPATGTDLNALPTGRETKGMVKVYSDIPLAIAKEGSGEAGAIVYWKDQKWEIVAEGKNQNELIPHYKYMAQYVGEIV